MDQENKHIIICDEELQDLFGEDKI